jgi:hypothetical protein
MKRSIEVDFREEPAIEIQPIKSRKPQHDNGMRRTFGSAASLSAIVVKAT